MERYAIYILSVHGEDPVSPEAHIRDCEEYVKNAGGRVMATYKDANIFGCETSRFEYDRFVKDVTDKKFDAVIFKGSCCLQGDLKNIVRLLRLIDAHGVELTVIDEDLDPTSDTIDQKDIMVSVPCEVHIVSTILEEIAQMFLEEDGQRKVATLVH